MLQSGVQGMCSKQSRKDRVMKFIEKHCGKGILLGIILGFLVPIALLVFPTMHGFFVVATGEQVTERISANIALQQTLKPIRDIIAFIGAVVFIPSFITFQRMRKKDSNRRLKPMV